MIAPSIQQQNHSPLVPALPNASVIQLLAILEEMILLHQKLSALLQREKRLMVEEKLEDLIHLLSEKEGLLGQLDHLPGTAGVRQDP